MRNILATAEFDTWFDSLRDVKTRARIQMRIDRIEGGNFGDVKPVGDGVLEMRFFLGAGYRVYFILRGDEIIILLAGGDKDTQDKDIKKAIQLSKEV